MNLPRRRERDDRRSVGSHEKMMGALGNASLSNVSWQQPESVAAWVVPQNVRAKNSSEAVTDRQYKKGMITTDERASDRVEAASKNHRFHKGM